nr:DUF2933 domain-containing protein [Desulfuromonadales bacterium]
MRLIMKEFMFSKSGIVVVGFLAVAGYFLWLEHNAHIISNLPLILVGACLVMHFFMHRGHGSHSRDSNASGQIDRQP